MTDTAVENRKIMDPLPFDEALRAVEGKLDGALTGGPPLVRTYTAHLAGARGKLLRAAALLACGEDEDGLVPYDGVLFAAAIELLHLATLVHDDIIDDADTRRGIPSLQRKFGRRTAVICGDYLLAVSLRLAAGAGDRDRCLQLELPDYVGRVCIGELRQQVHNGDLGLGVADYLRIIRGKTAALFEAAFFGGAILSTEDREEVRQYARLGRYIGMIFQLTDDCIDYDLDETTAKKPVQSDYEQGVVTLPLIHTLGANPAFRKRAEAGKLNRTEVCRMVENHGGVAYTRGFARRYYVRAQAVLDRLELATEKRVRLSVILDKAYYGPRYQKNKGNL